jgi:hypothetical protein
VTAIMGGVVIAVGGELAAPAALGRPADFGPAALLFAVLVSCTFAVLTAASKFNGSDTLARLMLALTAIATVACVVFVSVISYLAATLPERETLGVLAWVVLPLVYCAPLAAAAIAHAYVLASRQRTAFGKFEIVCTLLIGLITFLLTWFTTRYHGFS